MLEVKAAEHIFWSAGKVWPIGVLEKNKEEGSAKGRFCILKPSVCVGWGGGVGGVEGGHNLSLRGMIYECKSFTLGSFTERASALDILSEEDW